MQVTGKTVHGQRMLKYRKLVLNVSKTQRETPSIGTDFLPWKTYCQSTVVWAGRSMKRVNSYSVFLYASLLFYATPLKSFVCSWRLMMVGEKYFWRLATPYRPFSTILMRQVRAGAYCPNQALQKAPKWPKSHDHNELLAGDSVRLLHKKRWIKSMSVSNWTGTITLYVYRTILAAIYLTCTAVCWFSQYRAPFSSRAYIR